MLRLSAAERARLGRRFAEPCAALLAARTSARARTSPRAIAVRTLLDRAVAPSSTTWSRASSAAVERAAPYRYLWLDALTQKVREGGRIVNVSVVVATAVNAEGKREVLGIDVGTSEDGAFWLAFLRGLVARGLAGVELVTSDAHEGLKVAIATVFAGASWQRCRTHFARNLLARVPKSAHGLVATMVRTVYQQPSAEEVWAQHRRVVEQLEPRFPEAAVLLAEAAHDILAFTEFPLAHWKQVWSNNPLERLNKEIRRRTDVVGIFPNRPAILRLVGAVLAEQHDEWAVQRCYLTMATLLPAPSELTTEVLLPAAS